MSRTVSFNQFSGGMVSDPRNPAEAVSRLCCHFDIFTNPHKLTPYRSYIQGDSNSATDKIVNFQLVGSTLYGLGVVSGQGYAEVFSKTDYTATTWLTPANNQSSAGTKDNNVFVYYDVTNKIYGLRANAQVWAFDVAGGAWADSVQAISYTNTAPGLVHSKDDVLYIPTDNTINKFDGSSWTVPVLTLPSNLIITSICEYGNYLAIGCKSKNNGTHSKVFLWDRDSTIKVLPEIIDFGDGILQVLEELEGYLVGVSLRAGFVDKLVFRYYSTTQGAVQFNQIISSASGAVLNQCKQRVNNRLYFMASITLQGTLRQGLWAVGRPSPGASFSVVLDHFLRNTPTATDTVSPGNFNIFQDYFHIAYQDNGAYAMSLTDSQPTYSCTSLYETTINPELPERIRGSAGMRTNKKKMLATAIATELLTSGQTITTKYRVEGGSFTQLLSATADNLTVREGGYVDSSGAAITDGREYEFHFESTGGTEITEFKYKVEEMETLL